MKNKVNEKKTISLFGVLCIVAVVAALLPVSCNYIMQGGIIDEWIGRVKEIAAGMTTRNISLFPTEDFLISTATTESVLKSNLWFVLPGLVYGLLGDIVLSYRIFMLLVQVGTALATLLFFRKVFDKDTQKVAIYFGLLLYMTSPYRIYICYDIADMTQAIIWMLLPLYAWAVAGILTGNKSIKEWLVAAVALAGIGYADAVFFVIFAGITFVAGLLKRKIWIFIPLFGGALLYGPGVYRMAKCLFTSQYDVLGIQTSLIMENGYRFGEFFTAYTWKPGHPGMGMGLLICLLTGIWLRFVKGDVQIQAGNKVLWASALIASVMALCYFPWDFVQRLGSWALRFVSLMETPALFWGIACSILSILGAQYAERISKNENKLIATAIPIIVMLFCIGGCIYQCNTLTYERLPMTL